MTAADFKTAVNELTKAALNPASLTNPAEFRDAIHAFVDSTEAKLASLEARIAAMEEPNA